MRIVFIAPYSGKETYQAQYDKIISILQAADVTVVSKELDNLYEGVMSKEEYEGIKDKAEALDELQREAIANADAVVIEISHESFRVGNEATLAIVYDKPTLCLSQNKSFRDLISSEKFQSAVYTDETLGDIIHGFLGRINHKMVLNNTPTIATPMHAIIHTSHAVAAFGAVMIDIVMRVHEIPAAGQTTWANNLKFKLGGKATNAAIALNRLGCHVVFVGKIGKGLYGKQVKSDFNREHIETKFIAEDDVYSTGTAVIMVNDQGENTIAAIPEANDHVGKEIVDQFFHEVDAKTLNTEMVYISLELPEDIVEYVLEQAVKRDLQTFLHAAPYTRNLTDKMVRHSTFITVSRAEADKFLGVEPTDFDTAQKAATVLRQKGAKTVIVTMGSNGSILLANGSDQAKYFPIKPIHVVDTTASGDAFRAGFISTYLREHDLVKAMEFGTLTGSYAATIYGASDAMPTLTDLSFTKFIYKQYGIKNLIFDYNGVISDDFFLVYDTVMKIFDKYRLPRISFEEFKEKFSYPVDAFYKQFLPDVEFDELNQFYFANYDTDAKPRAFPHAKETLEFLHAQGMPMFIMSAHNHDKLLHEMDVYGIDSAIFKHIYADVKNKVETIQQVLAEQKLNPSETAYIGDTEHDVEAAKQAGVRSIASTYGYKTTEKLARIVPDIYINAIDELKLFI